MAHSRSRAALIARLLVALGRGIGPRNLRAALPCRSVLRLSEFRLPPAAHAPHSRPTFCSPASGQLPRSFQPCPRACAGERRCC